VVMSVVLLDKIIAAKLSLFQLVAQFRVGYLLRKNRNSSTGL
jgi:hypothetical protein